VHKADQVVNTNSAAITDADPREKTVSLGTVA